MMRFLRGSQVVRSMVLAVAFFALSLSGTSFAQVGAPPPIGSFPAGNAVAGTPAPGTDLIRFQLNSPNAVCNDGTPAVMYLREFTNQAHRHKWIIYLQGGGSCEDGDECRDRWASTGSQANYGLQKMSTSIPVASWGGASPPNGWTQQGAYYRVPRGLEGRGILSPDPALNPFAGWNVVYGYYCSSDQWSGEVTNQVLTTSSGAQYRINFRGGSIFDAIVAQLRTGATVYVTPNGEYAMPDLDNAEMVLLTGSSAGGNGVKHNLDRLRDGLQTVNPQMQVRGVIDAAGSPTREFLAWNGPAPMNSYTAYMQNSYANRTTNWNARLDASCVALNPVETWRCADDTHVLRHHITSPFFHRMDLQDEVGIDSFMLHYPPATFRMEYATHTSTQLHEIAALLGVLAPRYPAEEATIQADPQWLAPGVFGPRCRDHVGLTGHRTFSQQTVPDVYGNLISYASALAQWVSTTPAPGVATPELVTTSGVGSIGAPQCP